MQFRNQNCTTESLREALSGEFTFGDMVEPWKYGRFDFCPRDKSGLADIDFILGLNFVDCGRAHFGFFGMVVIPTGNRPKAKYIFEPLVGNGRFWEAGGGLTAHISLNDMCSPYNIGFWIEGNVTHFFDTHQVRSFDFTNNGLLSRYMLLKEFETDGSYHQVMINAINFATRQCEVSIRFQADVSAKLFAVVNNWEFDAGYNFYFKDKECIRIKTDCPCAIDSRIFGIKGLEGVCCTQYLINDQNSIVGGSNDMELNSNTQTDATMFNPVLPDTVSPETFECTGGNCVCLAWESKFIPNGAAVSIPSLTAENGYFGVTPEMPHFITCKDLDPNSAAQCRMLTHKVFAHVSYLFANSCYSPYVGIGGEVEFDGSHDNALSQWGAWLKCGLMF